MPDTDGSIGKIIYHIINMVNTITITIYQLDLIVKSTLNASNWMIIVSISRSRFHLSNLTIDHIQLDIKYSHSIIV